MDIDQVQQFRQRISDSLKEALNLRLNFKGIGNTDQSSLVETLLDLRKRLDRMEHLQVSIQTIRSSLVEVLRLAQEEYDFQWDEILVRERFHEYTSTKEKYATANVRTFDKKRLISQIKTEVDYITNAVESIKLMYRGLDSTRQDILTILKNVTYLAKEET